MSQIVEPVKISLNEANEAAWQSQLCLGWARTERKRRTSYFCN